MTITSLIENTSSVGLPVEHGLSLFIESDNGLKILFDMGQGGLFARNAAELGIELQKVDIAIISHGHYDHGGGLRTFLEVNEKAKVYIHGSAFEPHYSLRENGLKYIGLDSGLKGNSRLVFCGERTDIGTSILLFAGVKGNCISPPGNKLLFGPSEGQNDDFRHEQSLIIQEGNKIVLFAGCAHCGILNIMAKARQLTDLSPTHVFSGMHLAKSGLSQQQEKQFICTLAERLLKTSDCNYYTMHCTGVPQYEMLKERMGNRINYMSCGESVEL